VYGGFASGELFVFDDLPMLLDELGSYSRKLDADDEPTDEIDDKESYHLLDSSRYASLHPGYWVVFAGVYPSEPEATSRLREARGVQRGAHTERISR